MTNARVAGSDTREAFSTRTVRLAAFGTMLAVGPGIASIAAIAPAWEALLDVRNTGLWLPPLMIVLALGVAIGTWWAGAAAARTGASLPPTLEPLLILSVFGAMIAARGDARLAALTMPVVVVASANAVARACLRAVRACVDGSWAAATGVVVAFALVGVVPAVHVLAVGAGSGLPRAAGWSAAYYALAGIQFVRAGRALPRDRVRISLRLRGTSDPGAAITTALACRSVTVRFGPNVVLNEATLTVDPGEFVALVGANGAGKSTILRLAAGFLTTETGQILVGSEDVTSLRPEERAAAGLSFVSGARPVFPDLTVMQNLRAAAYRTHRTAVSFAQATEALLPLVPTLANRRDHKAGVLSGGEQRLLAVTQTLYRRPKVLLADELTLGLDHDARLGVMDLLKVLAEQGVGVVAVDHDLPSLLPRADTVALLVDGTIEPYDDPLDILRRRPDLLPATFLAGVE
ncbi:MAG TPA: ATP-binding cassette domain-containing protein [Actinomycetota bacterium]